MTAAARAAVVMAIGALLLLLSACGDDAPVPAPTPTPDASTDTAADGVAPSAGEFPTTLADQLQATLDASFEAVDTPGVAIGVRHPNGSWWSSGAGFANTADGEAATAEHGFRVGSITKTMTSATVLLLAQDGLVDLDSPLDDYVDGFSLGPAVTLRALLTHSSGVFNYTDDYAFIGYSTEPWTPTQIIDWALEHDWEFAPGEGSKYSNTNFYLLGMVIEAVAGKPYHEVVRERLLEPEGLSRTFLDEFEAESTPRATGYVVTSDVSGGIDMRWAWAAGGMVSTVADLCHWLQRVFREDVLAEARRDDMLARHVLPDGTTTVYGLGVQHLSRAGVRLVGHTGSTMGFKGEAFVHRESGACVAVVTNNFVSDQTELTRPVWQVLKDTLGLE